MNKLLLLLLGSTVALGLVSLHLVGQLRAERDNAKSLQARIEALQTTAATPQAPSPAEPLPTTEPEVPAAPAASSPSPAAVQAKLAAVITEAGKEMIPPQLPSPEERMRMIRGRMDRERELLQNPEYREAMKAQ